MSADSASAEELGSILQEGEKLGLGKAVFIHPLRSQVLLVNLQKRRGALLGQVQPLQTEAQKLFDVINPLTGQVNQLELDYYPPPSQLGLRG